MEKIIAIVEDDGSELGAVYKRKRSFFLVDCSGEVVQKVSMKITLGEAKRILQRHRLFSC